MVRVAMAPEAPGSDPQLRRARIATLAALGTALLTSLIMPGIGLLFERSAMWIVLGVLGIVAFVAAQAGALYGVVTPWMAEVTRRWLLAGFAAAAVLSVPLVSRSVPTSGRRGRGSAARSSGRHHCWSGAGRRPW
jgi:hypothetical protein